MSLERWLNIIGLLLNIAGTLTMIINTPPIFRGALIYSEDTVKKDLKMQRLVRIGLKISVVGFILQFAALCFGGYAEYFKI